MIRVAQKLLNDEAGFLFSAELILISTILTIGMIVGLSDLSHAVNHELDEAAWAFDSVNNSYRYDGMFDDSSHAYNDDRPNEFGHDISCRGW